MKFLNAFHILVVIPIAFYSQSILLNAQVIHFSDDFNDSQLSPEWLVTNYVREDSGSFAPFSELSLVEIDGELKIDGTCQIDTRTLDNQTVGWIGRSAMIPKRIPMTRPVTLESDFKIVKHVTTSGSPAQVQFHLTYEFTANNRILFTFGQTSRGERVEYVFDENNSNRSEPSTTFNFTVGRWYNLRVEFDPITRTSTGYVNGSKIVEDRYQGIITPARVGVAVAVRYQGDVVDTRIDNFKVLLGEAPFLRGDINSDGKINISDPISLLSWMFQGNTSPTCLDSADGNDDGKADLSDVLGLLSYLFLGSFPPSEPFNECGQDPSEDELSCEIYLRCEGTN